MIFFYCHSGSNEEKEKNTVAGINYPLISFSSCLTSRAFPSFYAAILFGFLAGVNFIAKDAQHYQRLAQSFLEGELFFTSVPLSGWGDSALFEGRYYWPLGPLPAVLAIPFVWLGYITKNHYRFSYLFRSFTYAFAWPKGWAIRDLKVAG